MEEKAVQKQKKVNLTANILNSQGLSHQNKNTITFEKAFTLNINQ